MKRVKDKSTVIGCMGEKPVDGFAECHWVTTKKLMSGSLINVYDSYREMASDSAVCRYRQIYAGMTSDERQCITCDVDIPFVDAVVMRIKERCSKNGIPLPTNIVVNTKINPMRPSSDQNHYQIQWELDKPFYAKNWSIQDRVACEVKNAYLSILRMLAVVFDGDLNYRGLWHKNAYCVNGIRRIPITDSCVSLDEMLSWYAKNKENLKATDRHTFRKVYDAPTMEEASSRNCYMISKLPAKIYNYMHRNNRLPTVVEAMEWARDLEKQSLVVNKKISIEPDSAIRRTVVGVLAKCEVSFDESIPEACNARQNLGRLINRVHRSLNVVATRRYVSEGVKKKEIARRLSVDANTVTAYIKTSTTVLEKDFNDFISFYDAYNVPKYRDLYKDVKVILKELY